MDWMDVLSKYLEVLLNALLPVLATIAAGWIALKVRELWGNYKIDHGPDAVFIESLLAMVVKAAEEAELNGMIEDKKAYALSIAEKWLKDLGITMDLDVLSAAIEAAVWEEFNKHKEEPVKQVAPSEELREFDSAVVE